MLRGNHPATVDAKGRIKIPTGFRRWIRERYGNDLFLTSFNGDNVRAYPLSIWDALERRVERVPAFNPVRQKLVDRVNYFGHVTNMDKQGRVLTPPLLREQARIEGEVVVMGQMNHLTIWNHELFRRRLEADPLTEEDLQTLADLGI